MKFPTITTMLRSSFHAPQNRRCKQRRANASACVSVEVCEPKLLLSATVGDPLNQPDPDSTVVAIDPATSSIKLDGAVDETGAEVVPGSMARLSRVDVRSIDIFELSDLHLPTLDGMQAVVTDSKGNVVTFKDDTARLTRDTYVMTVTAVDDSITADAYSYSITVMPVYVSPVIVTSGTWHTMDSTPNLIWDAVNGAKTYEVYISLKGQKDAVYRQNGITQTSFEVPVDLQDGDYMVWVKVRLDGGRQSSWGKGYDLNIGATPQMYSIADNGSKITWSQLNGAVRYDVWFGAIDNVTGSAKQILVESSADYSWEIPATTPAGRYGIWVRAIGVYSDGSDHVSRWNRGHAFDLSNVVAAPLEEAWNLTTFSIATSAESQTGSDLSTLQQIAAVVSVDPPTIMSQVLSGQAYSQSSAKYEFRIVDIQTHETLLQKLAMEARPFLSSIDSTIPKFHTYFVISNFDASLFSGRQIAVQARRPGAFGQTELQPRTSGSVVVTNGGFNVGTGRAGAWSNAFPIAIGTSAAQIQSTTMTNSGRPVLTWPTMDSRFIVDRESPSATSTTTPSPLTIAARYTPHYEVQMENASGVRSVVVNSVETENQFSVPNSLPAGLYSASVRATYDDGTVGVWTSAYQFQIYATPVVITGGTGSTVDATPVITWQPVTDVSSYDVWIGLKGSKTPTYRMNGLTTTQHRVSIPLTPGSYDVFVRAHLSNGGMSTWGKASAMQIGWPPVVTSQGSTVSWQPIIGATRYELWVNQVDAKGKYVAYKVIHDDHVFGTSFALPLKSGTFRVWIRAIRNEAGGTYNSTWSRPIDV